MGGDMLQAVMKMMGGGGGKGGSKGGSKGGGKGKGEPDPPKSGRVFVRGFDFGVTDKQFEAHMTSLGGKIHRTYWATKGSCTVVYKTKKMAKDAVEGLNGSTIEGNTRYIDVLEREG